MIYAYDRFYLEVMRSNLGRMFDYFANDLGYDTNLSISMFLCSGVADQIENGNPYFLAGMSGVEIAWKVLENLEIDHDYKRPNYSLDYSKEYWLGWALSYYQWCTSICFAEIFSSVSASDILNMYSAYHEMDISQFVDELNRRIRESQGAVKLKILREKSGLSQSELAARSGISVRTIQQYEQRKKNINKASAMTIAKLAKTLSCEVFDLLELTDTE